MAEVGVPLTPILASDVGLHKNMTIVILLVIIKIGSQ